MFAVADYDGEMGRGRVYHHREDMTLAGLAPGSQDIYIRVIVACQHGGADAVDYCHRPLAV